MCPFLHSGPQSTEPKCWCVSSSHTSSSQFSPEQPLTPHHVPQIQNPQLSSRMLTFHFISPSLLGFPRVCCLLHTSWPPEVGRCVPTAGPPDYLVQNLAQECCARVATKPLPTVTEIYTFLLLLFYPGGGEGGCWEEVDLRTVCFSGGINK